MAPKSTVSRSKLPSKSAKDKQVVTEPAISSSEEEDPEEEEIETSEKEPKPNLNGFVSDSGSDYDSDDNGYTVQPITKPPVAVNSPVKRPNISNNGNQTKKQKTSNPSSKKLSNSGGNSVTRIWVKDDEVVMLSEMYSFKKSKGRVDSQLDIGAFYDSLKGKLQGEYSKDQLRSKIKHMRGKYLSAVKKCKNGGDAGFASSHEALLFDLAKKAYGDDVKEKTSVVVDDNVVVVAKDNANVEDVVVVEKEKEEEVVEERRFFVTSYKFLMESVNVAVKYQQSLGLSDSAIKLMKENLGLVGKENASELDDEWKELLMEEVELNHKRASLVKKQVELVLDRIKKP